MVKLEELEKFPFKYSPSGALICAYNDMKWEDTRREDFWAKRIHGPDFKSINNHTIYEVRQKIKNGFAISDSPKEINLKKSERGIFKYEGFITLDLGTSGYETMKKMDSKTYSNWYGAALFHLIKDADVKGKNLALFLPRKEVERIDGFHFIYDKNRLQGNGIKLRSDKEISESEIEVFEKLVIESLKGN